MILIATVLTAATCSTPTIPLQDTRRERVVEEYRRLGDARDGDGLRALWKANPDLVLVTIDADLEGGLALWEEAVEAPPTERIAHLHERALFAALAASEALAQPILADYAASFVGWNDLEKLNFRAGQALYARALGELEAGDFEVALAAARETRDRAAPLGDWWGTAMGYSAEGRALQGAGLSEHALAAYGIARLLYHDLGLRWNELEVLSRMVSVLRSVERWPRARVAAQAGLELARRFEHGEEVRELLRARAQIERRMGLEQEAQASEAELRALEEAAKN
jgi:tetratricopeptide (TPR) repeat protein